MNPHRTRFDRAWDIGLAIDGVELSTYYGLTALKLNGRMVACMAGHGEPDSETLVIPMPFEKRDELLASDPDTFYLRPHYLNYPCVLVRLESIATASLRELIVESCRAAAALPPPRPRRRLPRKRTTQRPMAKRRRSQ
jgi:hypothetical protein